jgi:hypothetical protein
VPSVPGTERVERLQTSTRYLAISTLLRKETSHNDPPPKPKPSHVQLSVETKAGSGYPVPPTPVPVPTPAHTASQLCLEIQLRPCPRFPFSIPSILRPLVLQLRRPSSIASSPSTSLRRARKSTFSTRVCKALQPLDLLRSGFTSTRPLPESRVLSTGPCTFRYDFTLAHHKSFNA